MISPLEVTVERIAVRADESVVEQWIADLRFDRDRLSDAIARLEKRLSHPTVIVRGVGMSHGSPEYETDLQPYRWNGVERMVSDLASSNDWREDAYFTAVEYGGMVIDCVDIEPGFG